MNTYTQNVAKDFEELNNFLPSSKVLEIMQINSKDMFETVPLLREHYSISYIY